MRIPILPALLAASALALTACGDDAGSPAGAKAPGNETDRAFVAEMIPHHESAVEMAAVARERGESDFVKELAGDIAATQEKEIATLRSEDARLAAAGIERGELGVPGHMMGMDGDTARLETASPFDKAFLKMMVPHHRGAVEMAKVELREGADPELMALAQQIIDAQEREIAAMTDRLGGDAGHSGHG